MPGYERASAQSVIAEIGPDMMVFATDAHLCSWAKICPGNNESAGKRKSGSTGHGNRWRQLGRGGKLCSQVDGRLLIIRQSIIGGKSDKSILWFPIVEGEFWESYLAEQAN
jgi:hypothetical protein